MNRLLRRVCQTSFTFASAFLLVSGAAASSAVRAERATYHSGGALTALLYDGAELPVSAGFVVEFQGGVRVSLQPHDQRSAIVRDGTALSWKGLSTFANGGQARFTALWTEQENGTALDATATAGGPPRSDYEGQRNTPLDVKSLEYVIDLPWRTFAGGRMEPGAVSLPMTKTDRPDVFNGRTGRLLFTSATEDLTLELTFDEATTRITDHWDRNGHVHRIRVILHEGPWKVNDSVPFKIRYAVTGRAAAPDAHVTVTPGSALYPFDGFGGNYCFGTGSPITDYTLANLEIAWARFEMKAAAWDRERAAPGPELRRDFELMRRVQERRIPWVVSLWRLPERYYEDANQKTPGSFGRRVAADRWPEFMELVGSFLTHLKQHGGGEPDYFSFNEPDLGVDLGFTPETHRDTIKRLGEDFARRGLRTKLLLGDTANPRDTHNYVLATAADPDAMRYVGAVSFHSWGNGTPDQYRAWGDVAAWLDRPLIVGEAGVDPGAYRNFAYDSYSYGLREIAQYQDLLRHARPVSLLYWEYTQDYALARVDSDGKVQPTGRFWLMQQLSNLTPRHSRVVASSSDAADVPVSAFTKDQTLVLHVLNTGAARRVTVAGLPAGTYQVVTTTETAGLQTSPGLVAAGAPTSLPLPARSLVTLRRTGP